jgi:1,2-diacylglycerol 3-alpha-glucosyltransferase
MKILITTDLYTVKTNGVVTSVNNLTDELRRKGHDVRILTLSDNAWSYIQEDVYYMGSFPLGKVYPGVRGTLPHKNHILNELIQWCPDIIHSQCEFFSFQFAKYISKRCDAPIVHTYHTLYESYVGYLGIPAAANKKIVKLLSRRRLKAAETIIAPSQKTLSVLKGYGMNQEIQVVPTGISIDQHLETYSAEKRKELRRSIGIREDAFVLISIGDTCLLGEVAGQDDAAGDVIHRVSVHGGFSFSFSFRASVFPSPCDYMIANRIGRFLPFQNRLRVIKLYVCC